jgi:hypothetical protein
MRSIKLDDWVDGKPDAWDYEGVLSEHAVTVKTWDDEDGWSLTWKHGTIYIGEASEVIAKKAAAVFVSLWLMGVSASFADKLMAGYIMYLELQEDARKT